MNEIPWSDVYVFHFQGINQNVNNNKYVPYHVTFPFAYMLQAIGR